MEPVSEVYVVLSGKDLVYVTMNRSDAEGLQYRLNEAGVDAAVGPAVLVTKERYAAMMAANSHRDEIRRLEISEKALQDALEEKKNRIKELVADNNRLIEANANIVKEKHAAIAECDGEIIELRKKVEGLASSLSSAYKKEQDCRRLLESRSARLVEADDRIKALEDELRMAKEMPSDRAINALVCQIRDLETKLKKTEEKLENCRRAQHIQAIK